MAAAVAAPIPLLAPVTTASRPASQLAGGTAEGRTTIIARRLPGLSIILDHCGKPDVRGGQFQPWADDIAESNISKRLSRYSVYSSGSEGRRGENARPE